MNEKKKSKLLNLISRRNQSLSPLETPIIEPTSVVVVADTKPVSIVPTRKTEEIKERLRVLNNNERLTDWMIAEVPKNQMPFVNGVRAAVEEANMIVVADIVAEAMKESGQFKIRENSYVEPIGPSNLPILLSDNRNNFQPVSFEGGNGDQTAFVYVESQQIRFDTQNEPLLEAPNTQDLAITSSQSAPTKVVELRRAVAIVEEGSNLAEVLRNVKPVQRLVNRDISEPLDKAV